MVEGSDAFTPGGVVGYDLLSIDSGGPIVSECQFDNVSVVCKANIYFDGKVISHSIVFTDGTKKTLGLIYPGAYTFNTGAPEVMEIIAGSCRAKIAGESEWKTYSAGSEFKVAGNSSFEISVDEGIAEYVCSFG